MSINSGHVADGSVLIYSGECIILFSKNVQLEFCGNEATELQGKREGVLYLTTHRMIFIVSRLNQKDTIRSFSFPFLCLSDVSVEQPVFGTNYVKGKVRAQPNGGFVGEAKFKLTFKSGGAIDYCMSLNRVVKISKQFMGNNDSPPPYVAPGNYTMQSQTCPPMDNYYGWNPPYQVFPDRPDRVYQADNPPPYPGVTAPGWNPNVANGYGFYDPSAPNAAFVPAPNYNDHPPSYQESVNFKKSQ